MIPNPDCMIPADAVPVTPSEYEKLFAAQSEGKVIVARGGRPRAVDAEEDAETRTARNRLRRDRLLAASDWTQLPDSPLASDQRAAWATYRQALRDMDLLHPVWPEAPGIADAEAI
ncbi:MAG: hypothetical protein B7Z07_02425 [Sphingomonadales bacterium 32-67-7]|nr:MAG: hypothetical protein B7Z07_02425 [Sphingomonadales bacterium 32-67-7]